MDVVGVDDAQEEVLVAEDRHVVDVVQLRGVEVVARDQHPPLVLPVHQVVALVLGDVPRGVGHPAGHQNVFAPVRIVEEGAVVVADAPQDRIDVTRPFPVQSVVGVGQIQSRVVPGPEGLFAEGVEDHLVTAGGDVAGVLDDGVDELALEVDDHVVLA